MSDFLKALFAIAAVATVVAIVIVTLEDIQTWINHNKRFDTVQADIIKILQSGQHAVLDVGLKNAKGEYQSRKRWENAKISPELERQFGNKNRITIPV